MCASAPYSAAHMMRIIVLLLVATVWATATEAVRAAQTPARAVVETLHESLLSVMKDADALGYAGREARLTPVISETFDLPIIARGSTGRYWRTLDKEKKRALVAALRRLTVATYAARFDGYAGERFRILDETPASRGMVLVGAEIIKSDGKPVRLNYLVRKRKSGDWRIVDVYLDGKYSELALRRAEYTAVIKRKGFDGLLAAIESKVAKFAEKKPD